MPLSREIRKRFGDCYLFAGFFGAGGIALGAWISLFVGGAVGSSVLACKKLGGG